MSFIFVSYISTVLFVNISSAKATLSKRSSLSLAPRKGTRPWLCTIFVHKHPKFPLGNLIQYHEVVMKESYCVLLLQSYPDISEFENLRSTYFANCVFTSLLCYTSIVLNIVTINAIRKTSSLPRTLKRLLLSLAVSDVGVSLVGQPFYISLLVRWF